MISATSLFAFAAMLPLCVLQSPSNICRMGRPVNTTGPIPLFFVGPSGVYNGGIGILAGWMIPSAPSEGTARKTAPDAGGRPEPSLYSAHLRQHLLGADDAPQNGLRFPPGIEQEHGRQRINLHSKALHKGFGLRGIRLLQLYSHGHKTAGLGGHGGMAEGLLVKHAAVNTPRRPRVDQHRFAFSSGPRQTGIEVDFPWD